MNVLRESRVKKTSNCSFTSVMVDVVDGGAVLEVGWRIDGANRRPPPIPLLLLLVALPPRNDTNDIGGCCCHKNDGFLLVVVAAIRVILLGPSWLLLL